jgi:hypothetical protein
MAITIAGLTPLLEVFDLPTSIAFYRDVLGFDLSVWGRVVVVHAKNG